MRTTTTAVLTALVAILCACQQSGDRAFGGQPPPLRVSISQVSVDSSQSQRLVTWTVSYDTEGVSATFGIALTLRDLPADSAFVFTQGYFFRHAGSNGAAFLRDLARFLGVKAPGEAASRLDTLPVDAAITGTNLSRNPKNGYFTLRPPGTWVCLKIFLDGGKGEFYLNVDPVTGIGEIVRTTPEFGAVVVRELSRIVQ